jgi:hypothetical protein
VGLEAIYRLEDKRRGVRGQQHNDDYYDEFAGDDETLIGGLDSDYFYDFQDLPANGHSETDELAELQHQIADAMALQESHGK